MVQLKGDLTWRERERSSQYIVYESNMKNIRKKCRKKVIIRIKRQYLYLSSSRIGTGLIGYSSCIARSNIERN